jgi:hypothetical protein
MVAGCDTANGSSRSLAESSYFHPNARSGEPTGFSALEYSAPMKARGLAGVLACVLAGLALPPGAAARPRYYVSSHDHYAEAKISGSNGYRLAINVLSGVVAVTASKTTSRVFYAPFDSQMRDGRMRAHLPGVGRIALRFHERSRSRKDPPGGCEGLGPLVRRGIFRGRVKLTGERGYTRVDVRAVRGKIVDEPRLICRRSGRARSSAGGQEELLQAAVPRGRGSLAFFANEFGSKFDSLPAFFGAQLNRLRGHMFVVNAVYGFTEDSEALAVDRPPLSGSVVPPKPFTGTATFQREPGGTFTWLGDLAAELPGVGPVKLAGPAFKAEACLGRTCKGSTAPEHGSRRIARLYSSDSHSSALTTLNLLPQP